MFRIRTKILPQIQRYFSQIADKELEQNTATICNFTLDKNKINEAIQIQPELTKYRDELLWLRSYETFTNHGLTTKNYFEIITKYPELLTRNPKSITNSLELWRSVQFGEKFLFQLITNYPYLLDISDSQKLLKRITLLRGYVTSTKNVWKLLMNSPNLLYDKDNVIESKFNYVIDVMRIDAPEICKSQVFVKNLDEIKCRHVFLERLGLFKPRPIKSDTNELTNNPKLYRIMDTTDKQFSTKVAMVTLIEYETFKQLFKRELERNANDDIEDEFSDEE